MKKALEDIRVLEVAQYMAGPMCPRELGEMGAEIIKVEMPQVGDRMRSMPPFVDGQSYMFTLLNVNKKSITLDLKKEKGATIFKELVKKADVVLENFAPGVMTRMGVGYERLKEVNPGIIYCSVTGFGQYGPYSSFTAFDPVIQAAGGAMSVDQKPSSAPRWTGLAVADFVGPLYATIGILEALHYRDVTGEGQSVDISMQDGVWSLVSYTYLPQYWEARTGIPAEKTMSAAIELMRPLRTKDGYIVVAPGTPEQQVNMLRAIGEGAREPEMGKAEFAKEFTVSMDAWALSKTTSEALEALRKYRVPCAPILRVEELVNDPHLRAREMTVEIPSMTGSEDTKVLLPGVVVKLSESAGEITVTPPLLGQHNEEVYSQLLGYTKEDLACLRDEGVI
jgi:crotonobetainyl-CoA:carnitine CoA-transferase CaiB-like acyl-CoA transferase